MHLCGHALYSFWLIKALLGAEGARSVPGSGLLSIAEMTTFADALQIAHLSQGLGCSIVKAHLLILWC